MTDSVTAVPAAAGPTTLPGQPLGETISIRGARTHNLQNLDLDLPRDALVVITGPSGSGKSSLAFDTIFAEGQRRYIESLSTFARQFLDQLERPDVDLIEGLQPTLAIDQHPPAHNPRSTVATVTEIYDFLRLLYARVGEITCYQCGAPIRPQAPEQILDEILNWPERTKFMLLAPLVRGRKGQHQEVFADVRRAGLVRVRVNGELYDLEQVPPLDKNKAHRIEAVVDRLVIREGLRPRLAESLRLALKQGFGVVQIAWQLPDRNDWKERTFSTLFSCPTCQVAYEELEPRSFSFNSPYGACPQCEGLGQLEQFDLELVIPSPNLSLKAGAIAPWRTATGGLRKTQLPQLEALATLAGAALDVPFEQLSPAVQTKLWTGNGAEQPGLQAQLDATWASTKKEEEKTKLQAFRAPLVCPACNGARLRPEARAVRIGKKPIHEVTALAVAAAEAFFAQVKFEGPNIRIAEPILVEIVARLQFLRQVGLDYLTLDRSAGTLSGGEAQRIRLASSIGSGLVGVCYVLDEPSIGLHPRDNDRLTAALRDLQQQGNTVLVVEHDEAVMRHADYLLDMGPGAGRFGGQITAAGTLPEILANPASLTGRYLSGKERIEEPRQRRPRNPKLSVVIEGATCHNLQDVTCEFPLGLLVCLTGVSGSGKSSLLNSTLACALERKLHGTGPKPGPYRSLRGLQHVDRLIRVDQSPIGRTPRSNPATYTGIFDEIRKIFASMRLAKIRGYSASRFSFNVAEGRCESCQGQGQQRLEMNFLPDLWVTCPECQGKRFNRATLEVLYKDRSIADVLNLPISEALEFFAAHAPLVRLLSSLNDVGLGYLTLGQSSTSLSGGEAQRLKLAAELGRAASGHTMYILDEPTTGLHFDDIRKLLGVLHRLVDQGNSVLVIEHQLDVIRSADWLIDLGPQGGAGGGRILATGTPEELAAMKGNSTGHYLGEALARP